jgi:Family of unknown function (DUF6049)
MPKRERFGPIDLRTWVAVLSLAFLFSLTLQSFTVAAAAPSQKPRVRIAVSKNAYWYRPDDTVKLQLTLANTSRQSIKGINARVRIYSAVTSREELDASFQGKTSRSYHQTETYGPLTLSPGDNKLDIDIPLKESRYGNGVYPMTVELIRSGNVISSASSQLVVMAVDESKPPQQPLRLTLVFDTLEPSHRNPEGQFINDELGEECSSAEKNPGWYTTLLEEMDKWQDMRFTVSLSPMLLDDMSEMSKGYALKKASRVKRVDANSTQATDAAAALNGFSKLSKSPRFELLPEPEASPDLEAMIYYRLSGDAAEQLVRGRQNINNLLDAQLSGEYVCPPGLKANSRVLSELKNKLGGNLVLSSRLLERSREGRKLLAGMTLGSPVLIDGGSSGRRSLALFADARMQELIDRLAPSKDAYGVAQCILSELTNLYLERPGVQRACVAVAPGSWHPSRDVLDEVLRALSGAPWLTTVTLAENMQNVKPVSETALKIPVPEPEEFPTDYFRQVKKAAGKFDSYSKTVMPGNANIDLLRRDVYISESDVWRQWDRANEGLQFADFVASTVDNELAKVAMTSMGSITLTSSKADIPLSIVNGTGYRIRAVLKLASNGLTFPGGDNRKVLLEPKENLLEIPVKVKKKGRVRFSAQLVAENLILGELNFSVRTGRFNTFAVLLVGGLLALIGAIWISKIVSRRKVGKHKKRQLQGVNKEERSRA